MDPLLATFIPITLDELEHLQLLNRKDTKFVFHQRHLEDVLTRLQPSHRILEVDDYRVIDYENTYYDTEDLLFYRQHHNGERLRYKVRLRRYLNSDRCYFEIKTKDNRNVTKKRRFLEPFPDSALNARAQVLVRRVAKVDPASLAPQLVVHFSRRTFINHRSIYRVTVDTDLSFRRGNVHHALNDTVIAEIKQDQYQPRVDFIRLMRSMKIPPMRISKYCLGILYTHPGVKYNRFKPNLLQLQKISSDNSQLRVG